jgi:PrtD family type I secretion system ABC transporter
MRTSRLLLKQVRHALVAALMFSGVTNLLLLVLPIYTLQVFETAIPTNSRETLLVLSVMALGGIVALAALEAVRDRLLLRAALWIDHNLGQHILDNGLKLGVAPADLKTNMRNLAHFKSFLSGGGMQVLFDAPWVPGFILVLLLLHPLLATVTVLAAGALMTLAMLNGLLTRRLQAEGARAQERTDQWWTAVAGSPLTTGAAGLAQGAARQWEHFNRAQIASGYSLAKRTSLLKITARSTRTASQIAIYGVGAWLVMRGELSPGALVAGALLHMRALGPLEHLVSTLKTASTAYAAYRQLAALPPEAQSPRLGAEHEKTSSTDLPPGRIVLSEVTVVHPGRKVPALRTLNLILKPDESLGIVGPNGAGKSTLAALLAGAIVPLTGSADLDGLPIAKWQRSDTMSPIGYVADDPLLMEGSVHDNIARFREASLVAVARAAMRAGVHDEITGLTHGYDTQIGNGGSGLSLRERRAIALARAMFGDPRTIVLDEPEAGLDGQAMRRLYAVLAELKREGVRIIIATQDPRLLQFVDRVVVLNGGTIASMGTPADMMARSSGAAPSAHKPVAMRVPA